MTRKEWLLLITLSIPWGGSFLFFKVLVDELPPLTVAFGRVALAALALNAVLALRGTSLIRFRRSWGAFLAMGLLNNAIPFTLFAWGETRIPSGLAAVFNATTPVFAVLLAHAIGAERLTWPRLAGVAAGFLGVAVLVGPGALAGGGGGVLAGEAACLLAALTYALASLYGRRFRDIPPVVAATGQITGAALALLPLAAILDRFWTLPNPSGAAWASLLGISLLCTAFAYLLYFRILATAGSTNLMLVTFLVPVTALLLGHLVLGEAITANAVAGMALIAVGLAAIDGRLLRWRAARSAGA